MACYRLLAQIRRRFYLPRLPFQYISRYLFENLRRSFYIFHLDVAVTRVARVNRKFRAKCLPFSRRFNLREVETHRGQEKMRLFFHLSFVHSPFADFANFVSWILYETNWRYLEIIIRNVRSEFVVQITRGIVLRIK